ncbi:hypothetical protein NK491_001263 [Morganella morganii]|nr:hypothetical protein [Morganella morganii]
MPRPSLLQAYRPVRKAIDVRCIEDLSVSSFGEMSNIRYWSDVPFDKSRGHA